MEEKNNTYTGWKKWTPTLNEWAALSSFQGDVDLKKFKEASPEVQIPKLVENEYLLIYSNTEEKERLVAQYVKQGNVLKKFGRDNITWSFADFKLDENGDRIPNKHSKKITRTITPINDEQVAAFNLMCNDNITFKMLSGNFGSGKTLLTCTKAVEMLLNGKVDKIVWVRNTVKVKGVDGIGFLPGDLLDKMRPWLMPLVDNLKSESAVIHMIKNGQLEVPALDYLRGRCFERTAVVCTESQNLTTDLMKLIVGRIGKGSYLFIEGDFEQTDKDMFEKSPGMFDTLQSLKGENIFGYVHLPIDERSDTARLAEKIKHIGK